MRYISFCCLAIAAMLCLASKPANAVTLNPGTLIKGSGSAVYYYSQNGKRLVFPTEKTFKTWFADFSTVQTITDSELAAIPLGGNVTYRPGVRLVKITTDPKVYAVSSGGNLRYVSSETLAASLYGPDWNKKIDDVPDAFFTNYNVGSPITNATDFVPAVATSAATSIDADKATVTPPATCTSCQTTTPPPAVTPPAATTTAVTTTTTQTITNNVTLSISQSPAHVGDQEYLQATTTLAGVKLIQIFFDSQLITSCDYTANCLGTFVMPSVADKSTYEAKAVVTTNDNKITTKVLNVPMADPNAVSPEAGITLDRSTARTGETIGIKVHGDLTIQVKKTTIYVNDNAVNICDNANHDCYYGQSFNGAIGTVFNVYGIIMNPAGRTYRTPTKTVTIAANDSPQIVITTPLTTINSGNTLEVNVTAFDDDGVKYTEILDSQHNVLKHCDGFAPCVLVTGPWTTKGSMTIYGKASDQLGVTAEQSTVITIQ